MQEKTASVARGPRIWVQYHTKVHKPLTMESPVSVKSVFEKTKQLMLMVLIICANRQINAHNINYR